MLNGSRAKIVTNYSFDVPTQKVDRSVILSSAYKQKVKKEFQTLFSNRLSRN